jgi:hypothetical protein
MPRKVSVVRKNADPTPEQAALFERVTGFKMPSGIVTREGASFAIRAATQNASKMKRPMNELRLPGECTTTKWNTRVNNDGSGIPMEGATGTALDPLLNIAILADGNGSKPVPVKVEKVKPNGDRAAEFDGPEPKKEERRRIEVEEEESRTAIKSELRNIHEVMVRQSEDLLERHKLMMEQVKRIDELERAIDKRPAITEDKQPDRPKMTDEEKQSGEMAASIALKRPPMG